MRKKSKSSNRVAAAELHAMTPKERKTPNNPLRFKTIETTNDENDSRNYDFSPAKPIIGSILYPNTEAVLQVSIPCSDFKSSKLMTAFKAKHPNTLSP